MLFNEYSQVILAALHKAKCDEAAHERVMQQVASIMKDSSLSTEEKQEMLAAIYAQVTSYKRLEARYFRRSRLKDNLTLFVAGFGTYILLFVVIVNILLRC